MKDAASAAAVVGRVGAGLLAHGVTAFCPTLVTSPPATYHASLPHIRRTQGGSHGATVLGVHVEGPFIRWRGVMRIPSNYNCDRFCLVLMCLVFLKSASFSVEKKGAHPAQHIVSPARGMASVREMYGPGLANVALVTLAPELPGAMEVVAGCVEAGITVSLGHTMAELAQGEEAVR